MSSTNKKNNNDDDEDIQDDCLIQSMIRNQHLSRENIASSQEDLRVMKASQAIICRNKGDEFVCNKLRRTSVPDFKKAL